MDALPQKDRATQRRKVATNAIVKASTRPGIDMGWVLGEIAAERDRLDELLAQGDGEWRCWDGHDFAEAMKGNSKPGLDYERLTKHVVWALFAYGDDPEFWRHVERRIQEARVLLLPETAKRHVRTRL
jgi:hypothetical protein